ncbi:hypothetical protein HNR51_001981 [Methylorubrum thiocyanatum]|uniref:Uncharacterized protein n=1 Tax=Methylorubrum thiocyanatum TaxID=47958 RepID=A0AA40S1R7_9HYPH|nr:hypothetical protein [Methylorubrum thiocyanatum]GJE83612.1 hypothetical protein CJNNKLLH_4989 [Methylorubrum thiocyanatum]
MIHRYEYVISVNMLHEMRLYRLPDFPDISPGCPELATKYIYEPYVDDFLIAERLM